MLHFAIALLLQAQPAPPPPATALIVGRVVEGTTGRGVPGATVSISGVRLPGGAPAPKLLTDGNGRFVYRNLPAGSYGLTVTKPGYADGAFGRRRPQGPTQQLELATGERATTVAIQVWRHATIGGSVVDEAGEPVVGATVRVMRRSFAGGRGQFRFFNNAQGTPATTDDRGIFRFTGLTPGDFVVLVESAIVSMPASFAARYAVGRTGDPEFTQMMRAVIAIGSMASLSQGPLVTRVGDQQMALNRGLAASPGDTVPPLVYPTTFHPGVVLLGQASIVPVRSGEERLNVDIQMKPVPAVSVSGAVTGPDGPVANLPVQLYSAGVSDPLAPEPVTAGTVTDPNGAFTFLAVPSGDYLLRAVKSPFEPDDRSSSTTTIVEGPGGMSMTTSFSSIVARPVPPDPTLWASVPLQVGRRNIENLTIALQPGARAAGRIEFDGAAERPAGDRLRIQVSLEAARGSIVPYNRSAPVSQDYQFKTMSVPGGQYLLRATGVPAAWTLKSATYEGKDIAEVPIDITGEISGVVITFTDRPSSISGSVTNASGAPDGDATVILFPTDNEQWGALGAASRRLRTARTTMTGTFSVKPLPPGSYYIVALPDELTMDWTDPAFLELLSRDASQVHVEEGVAKSQNLRTVRPARER